MAKNGKKKEIDHEIEACLKEQGYEKLGTRGRDKDKPFYAIKTEDALRIYEEKNESRTDWPKAKFIFFVLPTTSSVNTSAEFNKRFIERHGLYEQNLFFKNSNGKYYKAEVENGSVNYKQTDVEKILNFIGGKSHGQNAKEKGPLQVIYFGAPGTGKSFDVDERINRRSLMEIDFENYVKVSLKGRRSPDHYCSYCKTFQSKTHESFFNHSNPLDFSGWQKKYENIDFAWKHWGSALNKYIEFLKERSFRTTFHPDYDYAQFVGSYKPTMNAEKIIYSFVPQVFAKAYVSAWKYFLRTKKKSVPTIQIYLIIEEINRGNCAQIFGDIFQLLDRNNEGDRKGFSQYTIDADCDFAEWLETSENGLKSVWNDYKRVVGEGKLMLPPNLNILATMNTSDQSLFPMDSAFKRRFDWIYIPINENHKKANFAIDLGNKEKYDWLNFLSAINQNILDITQSDDKQIGEFFVKPKDGININFEDFRSKVLFYLWDSVYKDEEDNDSEKMEEAPFFFEASVKKEGSDDEEKVKVTFQALFKGTPQRQKDLVEAILKNQLHVKKWAGEGS